MTAPLTVLLLLAGQTSAPPANVDAAVARAVAGFDAAALTAALRPHPRVLFTDGRMAEVRAKIDAAPWAADLAADLRDYADLLCDQNRRERNPADWKVQNGLPKRVTALTLAWKLSGERKYLAQAEAELLELCRQPAFRREARERRRQSLPVASGITGLAYGYDALRDDLPAATLREIEGAILTGGFDRLYREDGSPWDIYRNNWTHVIWGGTAVAAVALADRYPERCARVIRDAVPRCADVAAQWRPDGVSPEGTHYWDFGAHRHFCLIDALQTGLGTDFGLADDPVLPKCARWRVAARGPAGDFPYGDGGRDNFSALPLSWWAGHVAGRGGGADRKAADWFVRGDDLEFLARDRRMRGESKLWLAQTLLWLPADAVGGTPPDDLRSFAGEGEGVVNVLHRSSWADDALWLGVVGGRADVSHGHMHAGSFVLDAAGTRWVTEVPAHHYDNPAFRAANIELWTWTADLPAGRVRRGEVRGREFVYAWGSRGHNTLTVDGDYHDPRAAATLAEYGTSGGVTTAELDMTAVLGGALTSATRTFRAGDDAVTVTDRWTAGDAAATVTARMHTDAAVTVAPDGRSTTWAKDGRTLRVTLESADGGGGVLPDLVFTARPADQLAEPWDRGLPGITAVDVTVPTGAGETREVSVRLGPAPAGGAK